MGVGWSGPGNGTSHWSGPKRSLLLSVLPRHRYLGTAPGGTGALAANTHAEALEAAIRVVSAQVEGASGTFVAQASHNVVLQAQSWKLQDGPQEGLPGALGFSHPPSRQGA